MTEPAPEPDSGGESDLPARPASWGDLSWPGLWAPLVVIMGAFLAGVLSAVVWAMSSSGPADAVVSDAVAAGQVAMWLALAVFSLMTVASTNRTSAVAITRLAARVDRGDVLLAVVLLPVVVASGTIVEEVLAHLGLEMDPESLDFLARPAVALAAVTVVPAAEELWGRGLIYGAFARHGPVAAVGVSGALTAAAHLDLVQSLSALPGMIVLGWLRHRTGRLAPCVILHALNNLAAVIWLLGQRPGGPG